MKYLTVAFAALLPFAAALGQQHDHPAPEKLGTVSFATSCKPAVQPLFNRSVALLHSFTYKEADEGFHLVLKQDPNCAIAHWGSAMTHYHQLWDLPPSASDVAAARAELASAGAATQKPSSREAAYIAAISFVFQDDSTPYATRALRYESAMQELAQQNPADPEAQIFYALALISNASPLDTAHQRQKRAARLLEPLFRSNPDHPGIPHYLIHAYDNQELAPQGLAAAKVYAGIAPSAPHALHMPSHIFTRLGLWDDSVTSNIAAEHAASQQGDVGEQLHAMDYLVYAHLQNGHPGEAMKVVQQLQSMQGLNMADFKVGYAATAMPVRYLVEQDRWDEAARTSNPPANAQPHVQAIAAWARGLGYAHTGKAQQAEHEADTMSAMEAKLRAAGNTYWANQVNIMQREVAAWAAHAAGKNETAASLLQAAADDEDKIEKLPVTPGPILPAREQLGWLLLKQGNPADAEKAFKTALKNAPGRRGADRGVGQATDPELHTASR